MSKVFFISDTHFGHRNICKYRPKFHTTKQHDEYVIAMWNAVVNKKRYTVWVLGDMCIYNTDYDMAKLISRLNGNINLITGNHCHMPYYTHPKIRIMPGIYKRYGIWLSHCPIHPAELRGKRNIHGHIHNKTLPDPRYINVSADNINYTPISLDQVRSLKSDQVLNYQPLEESQ